ncbi:DUF3638 domain-containing protein [Simkania negevensis]|uniref:DUF3638 domain-containing protein n=1 Tax=Simkania negevensis TaxID=83561 RepID=A0ABS3AQA6_9BACT|nr:DUF3638 domain-containing protein [Simkania negevensis]
MDVPETPSNRQAKRQEESRDATAASTGSLQCTRSERITQVANEILQHVGESDQFGYDAANNELQNFTAKELEGQSLIPSTLPPIQDIDDDQWNQLARRFAHIHSDTIIKGTSLEGNSTSDSSEHMLELLDSILSSKAVILEQDEVAAMRDQIEQLRTSFAQIHTTSKKLNQRIHSKEFLYNEAQNITRALYNLSSGETYAIPGGWAGSPGHAMIYTFTKRPDGCYDIKIYNTGAGTGEYHNILEEGLKTKISPLVHYEGVSCEEIFFSEKNLEIQPDWILALLEPKVLTRQDPTLTVEPKDIYRRCFGHLESHRVLSDQDTVGYMTAQRGGSCSWRVLMAMLFSTISKKCYKLLHLEIRLLSFINFYQASRGILEEDTPRGEQARTLLKNAAEKLTRMTAKRYLPDKKDMLSQERAVKADATAADLLEKIAVIERKIQQTRSSSQSPSVAMRSNNSHRSDLERKIDFLRNNCLHTPQKTRNDIATEGYCNFQPPTPDTLLATLQKANESIKTAYEQGQMTTARVMIEEFFSLLPIPTTDSEDFWQRVPQSDLSESMKSFDTLLKQSIELARISTVDHPEVENNFLLTYAISHALAVRIDSVRKRNPGEPYLSDYAIHCPIGMRNHYKVFYCNKEWKKFQKLTDYFHAVNERTEKSENNTLFNFYRLRMLHKDCLDERQGVADCRFFDKLRKNNPAVNNAVQTRNIFYSQWLQSSPRNPDCSAETILAVELMWDVDDDPTKSALLTSDLDHLVYLRRAGLYTQHIINQSVNKIQMGSGLTVELEPGHHGMLFRIDYNCGLQHSPLFPSDTKYQEMHPALRQWNDLNAAVKKIIEGDYYNSFDRRSPSGRWVGGLPPESNVLIGQTESPFLAIRELVRTGTQPNLFTYQLLYYFRHNRNELAKPAIQSLFDMIFFKPFETAKDVWHLPLFEQLADEPDLAEQCIDLINSGIRDFWDKQPKQRPNVQACLFFVRLADRIRNVLPQNKRNQILGNEKDLLDRWLALPELSLQEKSAIHLHRLYHFSQKESRPAPSSSEFFDAYQSWIFYANNNLNAKDTLPVLETAAQTFIYTMSPQLLNRLEDAEQRNSFFDTLLTIFSLPPRSDKQEWKPGPKHPTYCLRTSNSTFWSINIETGKICNEEGVLKNTQSPNWENSHAYLRLFGKEQFTYHTSGDTYYFQSSQLGSMRIIGQRENYSFKYSLQMEREGIWYQYVAPTPTNENFNQEFLPDTIPHFLKADHAFWLSSDSNKPSLITNLKTGKVAYLAYSDGRIIPAKDEKKPREEQRYLCLYQQKNDPKSYDFGPLTYFERDEYTAIWHKEEDPNARVTEIIFPRYLSLNEKELTFVADEKGEAVWTDNRQYLLSTNQKRGLFGNLNNYLLLEEKEGRKQKLLLPLQKFLKLSESQHLTSYGQLDVKDKKRSSGWDLATEFNEPHQGHYRFIEYDVIDGKPKAKDTEGQLFLVYRYLWQREYDKALFCLREVAKSDYLSPRSQEIFEWLFLSGQENKDFSANAAAIRLHAYKIWTDHKERPEFEKKEEKGKKEAEERTEAIEKASRADYTCYLDGLQNVDSRLYLSKKEEVKLIESAFGIANFQPRHHDLTHNTPMEPIASAKQHPSLPSFTEPRYLPQLGEEYTPPPPRRVNGPLGEIILQPPCPALESHPKKNDHYQRRIKYMAIPFQRPQEVKYFSILFPQTQRGLNLLRNFEEVYKAAKEGNEAERKALLFRLSQIDTKGLQESFESGNFNIDWILYNYLIFVLQNPQQAPTYPSLDLFSDQQRESYLHNFHKELNSAYNDAQKKQPEPAVSQEPLLEQPQRREIPIGANPQVTLPLVTAQSTTGHATPTTSTPLYFAQGANTSEQAYPLPREWLDRDNSNGQQGDGQTSFNIGTISDTEAEYSEAIQREFAAFSDELRTGQQRNAALPHYSLKDGKDFTALEEEMSKKIDEQEEDLEAQKKVILALANRKSQNRPHALRESMLLRGRSSKELELNDLILLFLKGREELFYAANTNLDNQNIKTLHQLIGKYLINATHLQQWYRGRIHVDKLIANGLGNNEERRYLIEQLGYEFFAERAYGDNVNDLDPEREVPFLVFEYFSNMRIRPEQYALLHKMTETGNGKRYNDIVIQLIMGGGKTSTLASILGHLAAKPGRLALFVTPASQFYTVRENLKNTQRKHFHQEIDTIDLSRNAFTLQNLQWIHNKLNSAMEQEEMVVVKSETLQALELEFLSCIHDYTSYVNKTPPQELKEKIKTLSNILLIFREKSDATIDEVDLVLNALREVNFPVGEAEHVKSERIDVVKTIMGFLVSTETVPGTDQTMEALTGIRRNEQALLSQENYRNTVQPFLANKLADTYAPFAFAKEKKQSLIRYLKNKISPEAQTLADYDPKATLSAKEQQKIARARVWYEKQGNKQEIDEDIAFLADLSHRIASDNVTASEPANLIALSKHVIQTLLPATLGKSCGRHFGRSKNINNAGEVLPYQGVDTPSTTKFGYHYESIIYHYLTALSQGVSPYQLLDLANKFKTAALLYDEPFDETAEAEEFKELTGVALSEIDHLGKIDEAVANINRETSKLLTIETETVAHYVSFYTHRFTSTPQSLIDQLDTRRAMSGTPWNIDGYPESLADSPSLDRGTEGRIVDTMLQRAEKLKNTNVHVIKSSGAKGLLTEALANHPSKNQFQGIIDVGGHFKGINNTQVAREILEYFENDKRIEAVLFYLPPAGPGASSSEKKNAGKLAIMKKGNSSYEVIGGTSKELIEATGVPLKNLFVYYDENHTTGSDIVQCPTSKNFVTVDERLLRRNFFQGILRLRQFFYFQDVEYIVPEGVQSSLINEGKSVIDLISSGIKSQAIRLAMDTYRSYKQQINNIIRKKAFEKLLKLRTASDQPSRDIEDAISKEFRKYQQLLLSTLSDSPYTQFGRVEETVNTIDNLEHHIALALEKFPKDQQKAITELKEELKHLIDRAKKCRVLPQEVKEPAADIIGLEEEVELQVEQEAEQEVERELEQELQQELQRYLDLKLTDAIKETAWDAMPSIEELTSPNNDPFFTNKPDLSRPDIFSLQHILQHLPNTSFHYERKYHDIFDNNILVTNNFRLTGEAIHPVFSRYQKPGNQILAIEREGKMFFILLSSYDAEQWKAWLKANKTDDSKRMWLIQPDGTILQDNGHNIPLPLEEHDKAISRALLQINFFNGNMQYLNRHEEEVDFWLNESHPEMKLHYIKIKVEKDPVQKRLFNNSLIMQPKKYRKTMQGNVVHLRRQKKLESNRDLIRRYSPEKVATINPLYVHLLTNNQLQYLITPEQLFKVTPEQAKQIKPSQVPHLHYACLDELETAEQIRAIPLDKVSIINNENHFQYFSLEQAKQMIEEQSLFFGKLDGAVACALIKEKDEEEQKKMVACLSHEQIPFIDDPNIIQMLKDSQLDGLSPTQTKDLSERQITLLEKEELISAIDDPTKVKFINPAYTDFINVSMAPHLTDDQAKQIRRAELVANITQSQLPLLDDSVIKQIDATLVEHLADEKIPLLETKQQIQALTKEQKELFYRARRHKQAKEEPPLSLTSIRKQFSTIPPNANGILDRIIAVVKKIFVTIALIILSPLWAITFVISKIYSAIVVNRKIIAIANKAKDAFEQKWYHSMSNEATSIEKATLAVQGIQLSLSNEEGKKILCEKTRRLLWRIIAVEGFQNIYHDKVPQAINICADQLTQENSDELTYTQVQNALTTLAAELKLIPETENSAKHLLDQIDFHTQRLHTCLQSESKATQQPQQSSEAINRAISRLHKHLQEPRKEGDIAKANRQTLLLLEKILQSNSYLFLKESNLPAITFIHNICLAMHTKSHGTEEIKAVGKGLVAEVDKKRKGAKENHDEWPNLAQDVEDSYNVTRQHFADASGVVKKVTYAIQHPMKALSMLKSVEAIPGTYDPYAADNYPTTLGDTTYGQDATVRSIYAPTPTIGTNVRPLYKGLLQAVENNVFFAEEALQEATQFIFEINYQQMQETEGKRTHNIANTVMEYPFSLDVMTLPLDTDFYQGKVVKWENANSFFDQFKQHIFGNDGQACRTIANKGCGYFFTSRVSDDDIERSLDATRKLFEGIETDDKDDWKVAGKQKQRLFQDVFHLLIRLRTEQKYAHSSHNVLNYSHCTMDIDRGAMMTLLYSLAIRAATSDNKVDDYDSTRSFVCGALSTRALTIGTRSIMKNYAEETIAFLRHIPQHALGETIQTLLDTKPSYNDSDTSP